jgi:hypothetical protein
LQVLRVTWHVTHDILACELADAGGGVGVVEVLDEGVQLSGHFFGLVVQLIELRRFYIPLIFGDVELAADFPRRGLGLAQVMDELALRSTPEAFRALTTGKKYSWGAILDMMLTAARWI